MRVILTTVSRIHDVLRWANRREVAREVTERGYRVSGETLNRWVRDEQEFPAVVEQIVYELFTISGHEEAPPPTWAGAMEQRLRLELERNRTLIEALAPADIREAAARVIERLEALPPQGDAAHDESGAEEGRGAAMPPGRGPGSHRGRADG